MKNPEMPGAPMLREKESNAKETGYLSFESLSQAIRNHFPGKTLTISNDFKSFDNIPFLARITFTGANGLAGSSAFVYVNLETDHISYRLSPDNQEITRSAYKADSDYEFLKSQSESTKIVKSRPTFLYPNLLGVPYEELWPRGAKVAVIGDPYMACDVEGTTIVEYEFGEEMVPPTLKNILENRVEHFYTSAMGWMEDMHREDINGLACIGNFLERPTYSDGDPQPGNPYWHVVNDCFRFASSVSELMGTQNNIAQLEECLDGYDYEERLRALKEKISHLIDGTWERREFSEYTQSEHDQETAERNLAFYFNLKKRIMEQLGKPKAWTRFIGHWETYLQKLPIEEMRKDMPDVGRTVTQVRHWLTELPHNVRSSQRVTLAFSELEQAYDSFMAWAYSQPMDENGTPYAPNAFVSTLYNEDISDARSTGVMSSGTFGIDIPGYPVSLRTRRFLEIAYRRAENALAYAHDVWPKLYAEKKRLDETGTAQNAETRLAYLRSLEQPLIRSFFGIQRPARAVATHGFFPDTVHIEPQDRIVALTSVTMHGWNSLHQDGFRSNLERSLPFLKIGGRYILGPVNQEIYFGHQTSAFDCEGLTRALQAMRDDGLISYRFVKGKRTYNNDYSDDNEIGGDDFSLDNQTLLPGESASSLVIERIQ